jgi:hypothetical protein
MARKKKQEKKTNNQANVHEELKGLEININPFGEIETNYDIQEINKFLNKHVDDKKLKEREELRRKGLSKDQQYSGGSSSDSTDEPRDEDSGSDEAHSEADNT